MDKWDIITIFLAFLAMFVILFWDQSHGSPLQEEDDRCDTVIVEEVVG